MRVVIAEDEVVSRMMVCELVSRAGYVVESAQNGLEALAVIERVEKPCIAILDWVMPELEGIDVCRSMKQRYAEGDVYAILLTSRGESRDIVAGLDAGADDYLSKPFNRDELCARLRVGERLLTLQTSLRHRVAELQDAVQRIKRLEGLLPICMHCHKIRTPDHHWEKLEQYIASRSDASFSHGICADCLDRHYPE